jgi:hypothetical protein
MGDSLSRDLFVSLQKLLNVKGVSDKDIKSKTNVQGKKLLESKTNNSNISISESYFWSSDQIDYRFLLGKTHLGTPQVVVTNFGLSHLGDTPSELEENYQKVFGLIFASNATTRPRWRFFQTARDPRGSAHRKFWNAEGFRVRSYALEKTHTRHGFIPLDTFPLLEGRFDGLQFPERDGWHHHGSSRLQEAMNLVNLICNNE